MKTLALFQSPVIYQDTGSLLFHSIYLFAFGILALLYFVLGIRRKIPFFRLLTALAALALFFTLGSKLFAFSPEDWRQVLSGGAWPPAVGKTMLGGMAGLLAGVALYLRTERSSREVLDVASLVIPAAMAIQRIGCLLAGCCCGTPTSLPWGIVYSRGSHAWLSQVSAGLIPADRMVSLPVHPVQVYDIVCWLMIALLIRSAGRHLRAAGSRLLLLVILYGFFRLFLEFFRDPGGDFLPGYWLGLKYIQWLILAGLPLAVTFLIVREKRAMRQPETPCMKEESFLRRLAIPAGLVFFFLLTRPLFDIPETIMLLTLLFPLTILLIRLLYLHSTVPGFRFVTVGSAACLILLTSQIQYYPKNKGEKVKYLEISLGGSMGSFYNTFQQIHEHYIYHPGDCNHPSWTETYYTNGREHPFRQQCWMTGFDVQAKQNRSGDRKLSAGAGVYMGQVISTVTDSSFREEHFTMVVNPSFSYDSRYFGIRGGLLIGQFYFKSKEYTGESAYDHDGHTGDLHPYYIFPQVTIKAGQTDVAYVEFHLADHFPQGSPLWPVSVGIGSGLGKLNGTRVAAGYGTSGFYADCYLPIREQYVVLGSLAGNLKKGTNNLWSASFGFAYRFGYKAVKL